MRFTFCKKMNLQSLLLSAAILISSTSCDMREARLKSFDKDHWIQVALGTPLPSGISELEGIGDTWQGFWCHFRFRMNTEDLRKHLAANGYEEKDATDFHRNFTLDPRFEKYFTSAWSPDLGLSSKVYVRNPSGYQTFVLVDSKSDSVHVWTGGASSPGPLPKNN